MLPRNPDRFNVCFCVLLISACTEKRPDNAWVKPTTPVSQMHVYSVRWPHHVQDNTSKTTDTVRCTSFQSVHWIQRKQKPFDLRGLSVLTHHRCSSQILPRTAFKVRMSIPASSSVPLQWGSNKKPRLLKLPARWVLHWQHCGHIHNDTSTEKNPFVRVIISSNSTFLSSVQALEPTYKEMYSDKDIMLICSTTTALDTVHINVDGNLFFRIGGGEQAGAVTCHFMRDILINQNSVESGKLPTVITPLRTFTQMFGEEASAIGS